MSKILLDNADRRILSLLQRDAGMTIKVIADRVNLSTTPCWKRIQRLQEAGVIRATVALLDPEKVDLDLTAFVSIKTDQHNIEWSEHFAQNVRAFPEVTEVYRMSGEIDYMLKVVVRDTRAYDAFYKRLISRVSLSNVTSTFAMEEIKYSTELAVGESPLPEE